MELRLLERASDRRLGASASHVASAAQQVEANAIGKWFS